MLSWCNSEEAIEQGLQLSWSSNFLSTPAIQPHANGMFPIRYRPDALSAFICVFSPSRDLLQPMSRGCGMGNYYNYWQWNIEGKNNITHVSLVNQKSLTPTLADVGIEMPELCFCFSFSSIKLIALPGKSIPENEHKWCAHERKGNMFSLLSLKAVFDGSTNWLTSDDAIILCSTYRTTETEQLFYSAALGVGILKESYFVINNTYFLKSFPAFSILEGWPPWHWNRLCVSLGN